MDGLVDDEVDGFESRMKTGGGATRRADCGRPRDGHPPVKPAGAVCIWAPLATRQRKRSCRSPDASLRPSIRTNRYAGYIKVCAPPHLVSSYEEKGWRVASRMEGSHHARPFSYHGANFAAMVSISATFCAAFISASV